ncbi:phosphodiesterase [Sphingomonas aliaeris]|uniref:phosphodiesterase n=1 Tax=Sphingomonas aliaeris TaxID=2759526 RepID=UPI001CEC54E5|nr:phosphodiesterase [Sphingomonas aliaeris]
MTAPLLIAQITDLHLGFVPGDADEPNAHRLRTVVEAVAALRPAPDLVVVTGDLTDRGDTGSYERVRDALSPLAMPVHLLLGNHDRRDAFTTVFPDHALDAGFVQYSVDHDGLRIVALDTLDEARHGGAFCDARASWLRDRLDAAPDRPTLILLHHPPRPVGIAWMDTDPREPWVARLAAVVRGRTNIVGILAGHIHRPVATTWCGVPLLIAPSCAPEVALDLRPIDADMPDDRAMIAATPPGFALHLWDGTDMLTHFETVGGGPVVARYTPALQPMVREMLAERPVPSLAPSPGG